jgi:hypothetical protein
VNLIVGETKAEPESAFCDPVLRIVPAASPVEVAVVLAVLGRVVASRRGIDKAAGARPGSLWPGSVGPLSRSRRPVWRDPAASFEGH